MPQALKPVKFEEAPKSYSRGRPWSVPRTRGGHALFLRHFFRFIGGFFSEAVGLLGFPGGAALLQFDCASMAQNAFCAN
eukprot:3187948-Prymnesium_polylepis.1